MIMFVDLEAYKTKVKRLTGVKEVRIQVRPMTSDGTYSHHWYNANDFYLRKTSYEGGAQIQLADDKGDQIARFNLMQMPACCGICVLTNSAVSFRYQNKGVATLLGQLQRDIATWNGFTVLLCTDVATNVAQKKVLLRNGWFDIWRFQNKRTDNHVDISVTNLIPGRPGESLNGVPSHPIGSLAGSNVTLGGWISWLLSSLFSMD